MQSIYPIKTSLIQADSESHCLAVYKHFSMADIIDVEPDKSHAFTH